MPRLVGLELEQVEDRLAGDLRRRLAAPFEQLGRKMSRVVLEPGQHHALWSSLAEKRSREVVTGAAPAWGVFDFERPSGGCRFAPRCPVYAARGKPAECTDPHNAPRLREIEPGHTVACHFPL